MKYTQKSFSSGANSRAFRDNFDAVFGRKDNIDPCNEHCTRSIGGVAMCGHAADPDACGGCGQQMNGPAHPTPEGPRCADCWYDSMGDFVEKNPIGGGKKPYAPPAACPHCGCNYLTTGNPLRCGQCKRGVELCRECGEWIEQATSATDNTCHKCADPDKTPPVESVPEAIDPREAVTAVEVPIPHPTPLRPELDDEIKTPPPVGDQ